LSPLDHREKELWHNKILSSTTHQQNHRNYLQDNEVDKAEALEVYDVSGCESFLMKVESHLNLITESALKLVDVIGES
jgi:hypothetical protein